MVGVYQQQCQRILQEVLQNREIEQVFFDPPLILQAQMIHAAVILARAGILVSKVERSQHTRIAATVLLEPVKYAYTTNAQLEPLFESLIKLPPPFKPTTVHEQPWRYPERAILGH